MAPGIGFRNFIGTSRILPLVSKTSDPSWKPRCGGFVGVSFSCGFVVPPPLRRYVSPQLKEFRYLSEISSCFLSLSASQRHLACSFEQSGWQIREELLGNTLYYCQGEIANQPFPHAGRLCLGGGGAIDQDRGGNHASSLRSQWQSCSRLCCNTRQTYPVYRQTLLQRDSFVRRIAQSKLCSRSWSQKLWSRWSVATFKWSSGGRSVSDRKTQNLRSRSNGERMPEILFLQELLRSKCLSVIGCDRWSLAICDRDRRCTELGCPGQFVSVQAMDKELAHEFSSQAERSMVITGHRAAKVRHSSLPRESRIDLLAFGSVALSDEGVHLEASQDQKVSSTVLTLNLPRAQTSLPN